MKVVLLSGGLDSTVCLAKTVEQVGNDNVTALNIYYGQKHDKEIECARTIANHYRVNYLELDLSTIFKNSNCSLLKQSTEDIPEGDYAEQQRLESGAVTTYVPFRNGILVSVAASIALSLKADEVVLGIHRDDAAGFAYPDCSFPFYAFMDEAINEGSGKQVHLNCPFVEMNKSDIVKEGLRLNVPFEFTWSCYQGGDKPCGICGTCIDRQKAFEANGVEDPLTKI